MAPLLLVAAFLLVLVPAGRPAAVREVLVGGGRGGGGGGGGGGRGRTEDSVLGHRGPRGYDDTFMKKLCTFLGATYVRSVKDPICWYTWCHNGAPYHMQCPPGRSVSRHFYWSSDDPCTESDGEERCLVGFLKNMHLGRVDDNGIFPLQEDQQTSYTSDVEDTVQRREHGVEYVDAKELQVEPLKELATEEVQVEERIEPEPVPEPEPIPDMITKPEIVVQRVEEPEEEDGMYYPGHRRAHIVESFVPQSQQPEEFYVKHTDHYPYYTPMTYFPHHPISQQPSQYQADKQLHQIAGDQPHVEYLLQADLPNIPVTSENYRAPEGKQALIGTLQDAAEKDEEAREQMPEEEPLYDAEYLGSEFTESPAEEKEIEASRDTTEYVLEDSQQVAPPQKYTEAVTEPPYYSEKEEIVEEEQNEEEREVEIFEEAKDPKNWNDEEPVVYDYFKTHFVDEV